MVHKMEMCGTQQSKLDPCLFIGERVIAIIYVDDLIFWSHDEKHIFGIAQHLRDLGVLFGTRG
jgi:hypothetical protein